MQIMKEKKLIFTADDFGYDEFYNAAIYKAFSDGMLNSAALLTNFNGFNEAIDLFSKMKGCQLGVHLNIIEGRALSNGEIFSDGFINLIKKSYDKKFMLFVEKEFRTQIEKILPYYSIQQINSHVHVHAIPNIFKLVCKLATEYNIPYIRTQFECPYFVPDIKKYIGFSYPINMIKVFLLNSFTIINKKNVNKYGLSTNDYLIGVNYTANMDFNTIKYGLDNIKNRANIAEILVHPCYYGENSSVINQHYKEYEVFVDNKLKDVINEQGWVISK